MTKEKIWEKDGYLLRPARVSDAEDYYAQNYDPLEPETARLTGCRAAFSREEVLSFFRSSVEDEDRVFFLILAPDGRIIEPNVSTTRQRAAALRQFRDAGIPTAVWLSPILPFLNDTPENIRGIVEYCAEAGVKGILHFGMGVTLRDGDREYFYARLDQHFPGLKERYIRAYGNAYEVPSPRQPELLRLFHEECEKYGIWHDNDRIFRYLNTLDEKTDQMRFF